MIRSHTNKLRNKEKELADEKIFEAFERLDALQETFLNRKVLNVESRQQIYKDIKFLAEIAIKNNNFMGTANESNNSATVNLSDMCEELT